MTSLSPAPQAACEDVLLPLPEMGPTASGRRWVLREADPREALAIEQKAGVAPFVARALAARGVTGEAANAYLNPSLRESMPDPFVLRDMDRAAARLAEAVLSGETVGVFGDYDVDGTTAAAIFRRYFDAAGAPLTVYLPDRILEGYGPSIEAFRDLARAGARLVVTVDCGASAHAIIEQAAGEGLDVLVIDHHQMSGPPPAGAVAVVNPNRPDDVSGLANLSAAGVAFMAVAALNRALREAGWFKARPEPNLLALLDLAALGLVCDVMPITGLARVMVAQGLKVLGQGGNPGLKALAARAGVKGAPSAYHLGFLLGPRLNAAGRIGHARLALELLTGADPARLSALAERLHVMNAERQAIETAVLEDAIAQVERTGAHESSVIVAAGEGWHPGVIGVVAGRLKEKYDRPAIVIGLEGEMGKGSGRSIAGVDLGAAVTAAKAEGLLAAGGGHAMAAGLTVARAAVAPFTAFLNERLGEDVARARADRRLDIDGVVAVGAVSGELAAMIERAGPFGPGNPEPLVALTNVRSVRARTVGSGHVSCLLANDSGETARAVAFRAEEAGLAAILTAGGRVHVAGKIRRDDWRGADAAQFHIVDAARAG
ncbi:single-stranded-DNA-specific exonuclease RecJ [Amphiplicatus metriothermophilus]|uniref:Single-stranded-DNA-specific exonuclease RecJ n=1 Tax=Amphiplicatus metriothermophilus TaxID=1519374 RepID=A0A239PPB7_9PROT|nr:single-stranded-DNA-specific exonuclease RecJ [Amphiplicatus metriothermophilus]MBB5518699.1 single-stranded-DNA-specific exonuclease [Amphiplicatus metriothermophilus]SNT72144.1 exonuclease RecJ [Amphiplicatus metriothermophilus]